MFTGLDETDNAAWRQYCISEGSAFAPASDDLKGIKVSGKEEKGKVVFKGGEKKTENTRINAALLALALATSVRDVLDSTGFGGAKADVSELCAEWKKRRDEKHAKRESTTQNA